MIGYLKGSVKIVKDNYCIVDVNHVGYQVFTAGENLEGSVVEFFIHTHVREDRIELYGFSSQEKLNLFKMLIVVKGIGPKAGLLIVGGLQPEEFFTAVLDNDVKSLSSLPGIGSKVAQRLILELKSKVESYDPIVATAGGRSNYKREVFEALKSLGFKERDIKDDVDEILKNSSDLNIEEIIKQVLSRKSKV